MKPTLVYMRTPDQVFYDIYYHGNLHSLPQEFVNSVRWKCLENITTGVFHVIRACIMFLSNCTTPVSTLCIVAFGEMVVLLTRKSRFIEDEKYAMMTKNSIG